jgi:hypothetical protein
MPEVKGGKARVVDVYVKGGGDEAGHRAAIAASMRFVCSGNL